MMEDDITKMNIDDLREHFKDYNRDQLLLAMQTREIRIHNISLAMKEITEAVSRIGGPRKKYRWDFK